MEPVNNVERIAVLLREKLAERSRATRGGTVAPAAGRQNTQGSSVAALAAIGEVDERQFRRTVIQSILVNHFGKEVMNDASFQQIVEQVTAAIEADDEGRLLLDQAAGALRSK